MICQLPDENTAKRLRFSTFSGHVRYQAVKEDGQSSTACDPLSLFLKNVNGIQRTKARVEIIFLGKGLSFSMSVPESLTLSLHQFQCWRLFHWVMTSDSRHG